MNWEPYTGAVLLAFILLYAPVRIWVWARGAGFKITMAGYVFYCLMGVVLFMGYFGYNLISYFAPETELGKYLGTLTGRVTYVVAMLVLFGLLGVVLSARGITLVKKIT